MSTFPGIRSASVLAHQAGLLQSTCAIEDLEAVHTAIGKEIEARNFAKKNTELIENEKLLEAKIKSLRIEVARLGAKVAEFEKIKAEGEECRMKKDNTCCQCASKVSKLESKVLDLNNELNTKMMKVKEMETLATLKERLFQVGVAVRMGCLEQAKEALDDDYTADSAIIEKRNVAAHEGDWLADAALFQLGHFTFESFRGQSGEYNVWTSLYVYPPNQLNTISSELTCGQLAEELVKALDIGFTVFVSNLASIRSDANCPVALAWELFQTLRTLWEESDKNALGPFRQDARVQKIMKELQSLRDDAVRYVRSNRGRRNR